VVGVNLTGSVKPGVTATDLVLTVTEILRKRQGGRQVRRVLRRGHRLAAGADRATIANMAPEYGATMGFFPVDEKPPASTSPPPAEARPRGRGLIRAYYRAQQLFGMPEGGRHRLLADAQRSTSPASNPRSPAPSGRRTASSWPASSRPSKR
jgi:aconitate hydratase